MNTKHIPLFLLLSISICFITEALCGDGKTGQFKISSPAFENNGTIPKKYGCAGENVNPALRIGDVPPRTKSLALVFDDMDAPGGSYVHWILWNVDPGQQNPGEFSP